AMNSDPEHRHAMDTPPKKVPYASSPQASNAAKQILQPGTTPPLPHARTDRLRGTRWASSESSTARSFSLPMRLQKNAKQESHASDAENSN
ncbi:hypothetical protein, partial [Bordetella tumbae]|uniref:hypothetical protein n=1 Tax=Bordetella tumbae TaxID=1649139 RepID=UPI0039EF463F